MFRIFSMFVFMAVLLTACSLPQSMPTTTPENLTPDTSPLDTPTLIHLTLHPPTPEATATPKSELDLPIATSFKELDKLPTLTLGQFNSDAFNQQIIDRQNKGMYPDFPADAVVLSSKSAIILWNQDPEEKMLERKYGVSMMFEYNFANQDEWKAWKDPKRRQYQVVERYQIPVPEGNRTDYGIVIRVKNRDGTYGFWKEIYIPLPRENIGPNLQVMFDFGNPGRLDTPAYYRSTSFCKITYTEYTKTPVVNVDSTCAALTTGVPKLFTDWSKTGILNNTLVKPNGTQAVDIPLFGPASYVFPSQWNP